MESSAGQQGKKCPYETYASGKAETEYEKRKNRRFSNEMEIADWLFGRRGVPSFITLFRGKLRKAEDETQKGERSHGEKRELDIQQVLHHTAQYGPET